MRNAFAIEESGPAGGREGLACGKSLQRRWRRTGNNGVLQNVHIRLIEQNQSDPNGGGASRRPALPGLGFSYVREYLPLADTLLWLRTRDQ